MSSALPQSVIAANAGEKGDIPASMGGGERLVRAFSTKDLAKRATGDRLSCFGEMRRLHDQVDIGAANNRDRWSHRLTH